METAKWNGRTVKKESPVFLQANHQHLDYSTTRARAHHIEHSAKIKGWRHFCGAVFFFFFFSSPVELEIAPKHSLVTALHGSLNLFLPLFSTISYYFQRQLIP